MEHVLKYNAELVDAKHYLPIARQFEMTVIDDFNVEWLRGRTHIVMHRHKIGGPIINVKMYVNNKFVLADQMTTVVAIFDKINWLIHFLWRLDQAALSMKRMVSVIPEFHVNQTKVLYESLIEAPGNNKDKRLSEDKCNEIREAVLKHYSLTEFTGKGECRIPKDVVLLYCKFVLDAGYADIKKILKLTTHPIRRTRELCEMLVNEPEAFAKVLENNPWPKELTEQKIRKALNLED